MLIDLTVGPKVTADGGAVLGARADKTGASVQSDAHGHWHEPAIRGKLYTAFLLVTSATPTVGQLSASAAAQSTQFVVWNPLMSGINMVLQKLVIQANSSGAAGLPAGGIIHNTLNSISIASSLATAGAVRPNLINGSAGAGLCLASGAGTVLTGGLALTALRIGVFNNTATQMASPAGVAGTQEIFDGDIVIPPGVGYVPAWSAAGVSFLCGYSLTWEEVPV